MTERRITGLSSTTLADQAYAALREAIISGELAGGEKVTERGLAERLDVSPTPVREALRRLEQDHLVERRGPRAVQIAALDESTGREIRLVEGTLRALAARLAASNATTAQIARMERLLDQGDDEMLRLTELSGTRRLTMDDVAPLLQITRDFHLAVNEASNNLVLLRLLSLVDAFSMTQRLGRVRGDLSEQDGPRQLDLVSRYGEHRAVLHAVMSGDGERAEQLMLDHARSDALDAAH